MININEIIQYDTDEDIINDAYRILDSLMQKCEDRPDYFYEDTGGVGYNIFMLILSVSFSTTIILFNIYGKCMGIAELIITNIIIGGICILLGISSVYNLFENKKYNNHYKLYSQYAEQKKNLIEMLND